MSFLSDYGTVMLFYAIIIFLIYKNRKKFDFQAKFIAMYRTKIGIKLMHFLGYKCTRTVKVLGIIGVVVGFLGMALGLYTIIDGLYKLFFIPSAPSSFSPVIPGVRIPGVDIFVPFWYGIIALFVVVVIHEFAHGVVSEAYRIKVKHSGFVMFGPLPGAFVEPDEKKLSKASAKAQLSVYAAGPFSNVLLALVIILFFGFLPMIAGPSPAVASISDSISIINFAEIMPNLQTPTGMYVGEIDQDGAAITAGLPEDVIITSINDIHITDNATAFSLELFNITPNQEIVLANESHSWVITTKEHPIEPEKGYIGIRQLEFLQEPSAYALENYGTFGYHFYLITFTQLFWIILLSLGIGLANLLPLGPVDGGRMLLTALEKVTTKKRAQIIWSKTAMILLVIIILLVFVPILKAIFGG